jgi:hypothetical protein
MDSGNKYEATSTANVDMMIRMIKFMVQS